MLQTLRIRNLAIVEDIRVDLAQGLNVVTGETGAGKSIIAGALGLVLGERADKTMVRAGEDKCGVEAIFHLADSSLVDTVLDELGLDPCEDGRLIVRRIVAASGSGKNSINDSPTTVQALKRVGDLLVDMHGPHDHQSLLNREFQLDLLDSYGNLWKARSEYEELYGKMTGLERRRSELDSDEQEVAQQIDVLSYQVKEIDDAGLTDMDEVELEQEHARIANAHRILELAAAARQALTEEESAAANGIAFALQQLSAMTELVDECAEWRQEAESISIQIRELSSAVNSYAQDIEGDPGRLQWLEDRMALLHRLKRKYGSSMEDILTFLESARARLADLESRGEKIAEIESEIQAVRAELEKAGKKLGKGRRKAADSLGNAVTDQLHGLGFPHGAFRVDVESGKRGPSGMDEVEFGFAPNVGEPMRPLRAIASSGEISRVMLATKAVLAVHDRIPVLVFDEIDANVGGEMGNAIGTKLETVSKHHQVMCITHLPQVAVHAKTHLVVTKHVHEGRTRTRIEPLEGDGRVEEIARMLGGKKLTGVTLEHAKQMLER